MTCFNIDFEVFLLLIDKTTWLNSEIISVNDNQNGAVYYLVISSGCDVLSVSKNRSLAIQRKCVSSTFLWCCFFTLRVLPSTFHLNKKPLPSCDSIVLFSFSLFYKSVTILWTPANLSVPLCRLLLSSRDKQKAVNCYERRVIVHGYFCTVYLQATVTK